MAKDTFPFKPESTWDICPICDHSLYGKVKLRIGSNYQLECGECKSWIYMPRVERTAQIKSHDNEAYFNSPYYQNRRYSKKQVGVRCQANFALINKALPLNALRGKRMLDVGCDTGEFLSAAKAAYGIVPVGIDVSYKAFQIASQKGLEVFHGEISSAPRSFYNFPLITAIDLIEHVPSPHDFLLEVNSRLRPGGVMFLVTPNPHASIYSLASLIARYLDSRPRSIYSRLFPTQHAFHFTRKSLALLAVRSGFEIVHLGSRPLSFKDIAAGLPVRLILTVLQFFDRLGSNKMLITAVLRKPGEEADL